MLTLLTAHEVTSMEEEELNSHIEEEGEGGGGELPISLTGLAGHVINSFDKNKTAKQYSNVNSEILESVRAFNGEYGEEEALIIQEEGGSNVYMNLTATKCRTLMSWIRDIYASTKKPWTIRPTTIPELPESITQQIQKDIEQRIQALQQEDNGDVPVSYRRIKELERASIEAFLEEANTEAMFNFKIIEKKMEDRLNAGGWKQAISDFIEHFSIYPTAFLKGPVVSSKKKLTWSNGEPIVNDEYVFRNYCVNPLDMYPSPSANTLDDDDLIEHLRLTESSVYKLIGLPGYDDEKLREAIEIGENYAWYDEYVETSRALTEMKGDQQKANDGIIHGLHFFGSAKRQDLLDWGLGDEEMPRGEMVEVEAIMIGNEVVKVSINKDPLGRRPYVSASFQKRPGSVWGRSLPNLMRDIQRICNGTARALMNNMGLSSGPQGIINVDRLADDGEIEEMYPRKLWQVTNDPTGNSGRAVDFFTVPSVANELLAVYEKFAIKADDATGVPRYAHGNERVGGAATTVGGLSMLLETTTKSVKDAVRHIDESVEKRLEYEFYMVVLSDDSINFTGDIEVEAIASQSLTLAAAEKAARMEFMQLTANEVDQKIMGIDGRSTMLRELGEDLGFIDPIVPNRLEAKEREKRAQIQAQQEQEKPDRSLAATQLQVDAQREMNAKTQETERLKVQQRQGEHTDKMTVEQQKIQADREKNAGKLQVQVENKNKDVALELRNQ